MKKGEWYYTKSCKHVKNHVKHASRNHQTIAYEVANGIARERARKVMQFTIVLHLLQHGHPMFEYESMKVFFEFLVVPKNNKKHWNNIFGW
jgi:hypothetical protein